MTPVVSFDYAFISDVGEVTTETEFEAAGEGAPLMPSSLMSAADGSAGDGSGGATLALAAAETLSCAPRGLGLGAGIAMACGGGDGVLAASNGAGPWEAAEASRGGGEPPASTAVQ